MAIPAYYSLIQKGSSGPDVALVQTWLNGIRDTCTWHDILKTDGHFGTASEKAVTEFQLRNKLTVDTAAHGLHVPYPGVVIRQGDSGGAVRLIQQKLRGEGETLTADGKFGAKTAEAVRRYQKRNSLAIDGSVGSATWEKMF